MALPARGQGDWDDEMANHIAGMEASVASAVANASQAVSNSNTAISIAQASGGGGAVDSVNSRTGAVTLTRADVGLDAVDNTADSAKPVSTAQAAALTGKASSTHAHVATTDLTATGTKDATTYLRGDNTWAVPAGGGGAGSDATPRAAAAYMVYPAGAVTTTGFFNFKYFTPMVLGANLSIDEIGIEIATAQAAAATVEVGYYTQDATGTLIRQVSFGSVASDVTGVKTLSGSWTLPAGVIWLAISSSASSGGSFRAGTSLALPGPVWVPGSAQIASAANGLRSSVSGALPVSVVPSSDGGVSMPRFLFRKA